MRAWWCLAFLISWPLAFPAGAQELFPPGHSDLTVYGGVMTEGDFPGDALIPFYTKLEDVYFIGAAYNRDFADLGHGFVFGGEAGLGARFGDGSTGEIWFGPSLRYEGLEIGKLGVSLGLVGGFSAVTGPEGYERRREGEDRGDATFLYYAGAEVALSWQDLPHWQLVVRNHHRSGGRNVSYLPDLGDMGEASNTNVVGIRYNF